MVTIIRNAKVYQPEYAGVKDILILGDRIAAVGEHLRADFGGSLEVQEINGEGMAAVPGFIDSHEHIMGGGGEGGFHTRTPEASLGSDPERDHNGSGLYRHGRSRPGHDRPAGKGARPGK